MFMRMFCDIETSPCIGTFWRPGRNLTLTPENIITEAKIICVSWSWQHSDDVHALYWDQRRNDKQMLKGFLPELARADDVIAHNGRRFDVPWLRARATVHGLDMPPIPTVTDTLRLARGHFRFASNRMGHLATLLKVTEKGSPPLKLWHDVAVNNDRTALYNMVSYCKNDVKVLKQVYTKIMKYIEPTVHVGGTLGRGKHTCPGCGGSRIGFDKSTATKSGTVKFRMRCGDCKAWFMWSPAVYEKFVKRLNKV